MGKATLPEGAAYTTACAAGSTTARDVSATEAMQLIQRCLSDCVTRADSHDIPAVCEFREMGSVDGLLVTQWQLECSEQATLDTLALNVQLTRSSSIRLEARYDGCDMALLGELRKDGLKVISSRVSGVDSSNKAMSLEIQPTFPAGLRFERISDTELSVWIANFDRLGARRYRFNAASVDAEFCFQLDEYITSGVVTWEGALEALGEPSHWSDMPLSVLSHGKEKASASILAFERSVSDKAQLTLQLSGLEYQLGVRSEPLQLGRGIECPIRIDALSVSRQHASLRFDDGFFYLEDASSNGTFIQQRGKPELFIHRGLRKLKGEGVISLGRSALDPESHLIHYRVDAGRR